MLKKLLKLAVLKCVYAFIHILKKQLIVKLSIRSSTSNAETKALELAFLWSVDIKSSVIQPGAVLSRFDRRN